MATRHAVILARGLGTRMRRAAEHDATLSDEQRAAADAGAKAMIPFARPFLDYVISALADAGMEKVTLVVAPGASHLRDHYETDAPRRVRIGFAVQDEPRGTADAVYAARHAVGDESFLALNADNYYPVESCRRLAALGGAGIVAYEAETLVRESGIERERVLKYALLHINERDELVDIREKPDANDPLAQHAERWVSMNLWAFTPRIFEACSRVQPSQRGELELADAVRIAIRDLGEIFRVVREHAGVLDLSSKGDIAHVASRLSAVTPKP